MWSILGCDFVRRIGVVVDDEIFVDGDLCRMWSLDFGSHMCCPMCSMAL